MTALKDLVTIHDTAMKHAQEAYMAQLKGNKEH